MLLEHEGKVMTVANLSIKHAIFQSELDLIFQCGESVAFSTGGAKLPVTLTGVSGEDEESDDDEEDYLDEMADESMDEGKEIFFFL